jgi:hypothetical protein
VPLETYGAGPLEDALRDMRWVGEVAVAHESVVEHFARARGATVLPMKLFTMFSSVSRAVEDVEARRREIVAVLGRVRGCVEYGVRVMQQPVAAGARAKVARASSGAAFLAAKKQSRDDARAAIVKAAEAAEDVFVTLAAMARASRRRDVEPEGVVTPPLLDAAFLVPATARTRFKAGARRAAAGCTRAGAEMTLTGPWPPYNFVQLESPR